MKVNLVKYRTGRLLLHVGCIFRRPHHAGFYLAGIAREAREVWFYIW